MPFQIVCLFVCVCVRGYANISTQRVGDTSKLNRPVRIRARPIGPPHLPHVSWKATKWGCPSNETGKTEALCHSRYDTIKIPPAQRPWEHRPEFCRRSPVMVTFPYKWTILERDVKPYIITIINYPFYICSLSGTQKKLCLDFKLKSHELYVYTSKNFRSRA